MLGPIGELHGDVVASCVFADAHDGGLSGSVLPTRRVRRPSLMVSLGDDRSNPTTQELRFLSAEDASGVPRQRGNGLLASRSFGGGEGLPPRLL